MMNSQWSHSQSPNPRGPAACHAHSLTAALRWLCVPKSEIIWKNIHTGDSHTPNPNVYGMIPITTEVLLGKHQSHSGPTLPSTWAHCHTHSLTAARRWLRVPKSEIIRKIYTQGIHTPQTQMYTIPITTEVLLGKHQSHSGPTLPSTWAHCHAHSLRAAARCQVHVPTSGIIIWKIHTQGPRTPPTQTYTIPITTEVLSGKHQSHSGPTLPSTWAHCHAHSLRAAARCQVHVPTSGIIIWKIHTQGLHTPPPQTYTIPIMTEVLSGKHQSQSTPPSAPTLSSTWAHCHTHSLRAAACCQLHVPTSVIIKWKIHTQGLHTPTPPTYTIPIMTEVLSGKYQSQ